MKRGLILLGVVAIILIGGYFALSFYAVKFIQARIQKVERPGLTIAEIEAKTAHLNVKGIRYEGPHSKQKIFEIEEMKIYPGLLSPLTGTLRIRTCTLLKPQFFFYRSQEGIYSGLWVPPETEEKGGEILKDREREGKKGISVKIDALRIQKGSIHFEDRGVGENPAKIKLRDLDAEIKDVQFPFASARSLIELKGKMKGGTKEGAIEAKGWIDLKTMDMDTAFKAQEMEVRIFEPYYCKRVSAKIKAGVMDMEAKVVVKKKVIDAPGQLELIDFRIEGEGTVFWIPAKNLVSLLKKKGGRLKLPFHIKGNLDDPRFTLQDAILTGIAVSYLEASGVPVKVLGEEVFGGVGKEGEGWAEGLKSLREVFKRKKENRR